MSAGDYGPRPPLSGDVSAIGYQPPCWQPPAQSLTNKQLLLLILERQHETRELFMTAVSVVQAATSAIGSADDAIKAATKVISQADTGNVPKADLDALSNAQAQLVTDTTALRGALAADVPTATATSTSTLPFPTSTATTSTGVPTATATATAGPVTSTSTAQTRANEIRDSHLS